MNVRTPVTEGKKLANLAQIQTYNLMGEKSEVLHGTVLRSMIRGDGPLHDTYIRLIDGTERYVLTK